MYSIELLEDYISKGYYLIPLNTYDKAPRVDNNFANGAKSATNDYDLLNIYWHAQSYGLVCSNCTVLDFDIYKGLTMEMQQLFERCIERKPPVQITPSGGVHMVFSKAPDLRLNIKNVDVRNDNQYIAVSPKEGYRWHTPLCPCKDLPALPLLDGMQVGAAPFLGTNDVNFEPNQEQMLWIMEWVSQQEPAVSGQGGHNQTYKVAYDLRVGFNLNSYQVLWLLEHIYNSNCYPQWSHRELSHKVESIVINSRPGYLIKNIRAEIPDVDLGLRTIRAYKYIAACVNKGQTNLGTLIAHLRLGFDLDVDKTIFILSWTMPTLEISEPLKDMIYNPIPVRAGTPNGYLLPDNLKE